jgi:hypothetical protein
MLLCSQVGITVSNNQVETESNLRVPYYRTAALVPALDLILILISRGYLASNRYPHHHFN